VILAALLQARISFVRPMLTTPPLSLYVHLPWCVRKCPYCDFNSYEAKGPLADAAYVDALLRDLDTETRLAGSRRLQSIFIGGGTPSLFSGVEIRRLLEGVGARVPIESAAEITLEANPGAVEAERFAAYRNAGVNRLSVGVQSFRPAKLKALGRVHNEREAVRAIGIAREAGFENINVDLMYGLPGDDEKGAIGDLERAIEQGPSHLSWYQLTLEPNTAFHRDPPALPDEDCIEAIEATGRSFLERHGYGRYEVSAYARPGFRCVHNLNYWQFGDYIGIGAGAHGKVSDAADNVIERRSKQRNPRTYMAHAGTPAAVTVERIEAGDQLVLEFMMNALRLPEGTSVASFEERTGQPRATIDGPLREAASRGWLRVEADRLKPTRAGLQMLNALLALF
jgi:oxygen-independent coproporphyrinogen-3 oxidase